VMNLLIAAPLSYLVTGLVKCLSYSWTNPHAPLVSCFFYWTRPIAWRIVFAGATSKKPNCNSQSLPGRYATSNCHMVCLYYWLMLRLVSFVLSRVTLTGGGRYRLLLIITKSAVRIIDFKAVNICLKRDYCLSFQYSLCYQYS
jgi:hypothetical protein